MIEITLHAPGRNALGSSLMTSVREALEKADGAPILLTGAGETFSAGLNLKELMTLDAAGMETFLRNLQGLCAALAFYPGPTVAAINGHAIAGGAILALLCDYRVCTHSESARIGLNEVALGLQFPPALLDVVRRRLPPQHLATILLSAQLFAPTDALRLGLVDELAFDVADVARSRLALLAGHPRSAYVAAKRALYGSALIVAPEQEARFIQDVLPVWSGDALKARIAALLKK